METAKPSKTYLAYVTWARWVALMDGAAAAAAVAATTTVAPVAATTTAAPE